MTHGVRVLGSVRGGNARQVEMGAAQRCGLVAATAAHSSYTVTWPYSTSQIRLNCTRESTFAALRVSGSEPANVGKSAFVSVYQSPGSLVMAPNFKTNTLFLLPTIVAAATLSFAAVETLAQTPEPLPLELETKIPLGDVRGRIDHIALDLIRQRLFVAELGNDTVGVVDLNQRKVIHTISGLNPTRVGKSAPNPRPKL